VERFNPYKDNYSQWISGDYWSKNGSTIGFDMTTKSTLAELGFNYNQFLSFAANYQHNDFPGAHNDAYTFASSFIFSNAFEWHGNVFSFGNIRANYGKADFMNNVTFPVAFPYDRFDLGSAAIGGSKFEAGGDFGFLNGRITLTANRFYNVNDNTYLWVMVPNGSNFSNYVLIDIGETNIKGWELLAGAKIMDKSNLKWSARINWSNSKTITKPDVYLTNNMEINPGWESGILNQFEIKQWFVSFLIDTRYDADYMVLDRIDGGMPVYRIDEVSQTKLRDLSVGYTLPTTQTNGTLIRISVSGRNLWTIQTTADSDFENTMGSYSTMKNFSVSIGATF
jgi:hypothetical protein